ARAQELKFTRQQPVENLDELCQPFGVNPKSLQTTGPDWLEGFAGFLQNPMVAAVLVRVGLTRLVLGLKIPGVRLPRAISAICFILFFGARAQLACAWLAVLLFLLGLVLIGLEIFVVPGLAVLGISGVILVLASLGLATLEHWPQSSSERMEALTTVGRFGL